MDQEYINNILTEVIENSKYSSVSQEQKETIKKKIIQKYINDFNLSALEVLDKNLQPEFSKLLANANQTEIEVYIARNITDLETVTKKASEKFSNELYNILS